MGRTRCSRSRRGRLQADQVLDLVLAEGGGLEATDDQGLTVLQRCIVRGHSPFGKYTIQRLLDRHANIKVLNNERKSVLHLAAAGEYSDALMVLLYNGRGVLNVNGRDKHRMTALHYATAAGNGKCTFFLLKANANVALRNRDGQSALHLAASSHNRFRMIPVSALDALLFRPPSNLDVNAPCSGGKRPLHYAADLRDLDAMRLLVSSGADLEAVDFTGLSGLDSSAHLVPLIQQALEKGQKVTSIIHEDKTLWYLLTLMHTRAKIVKRIEELANMNFEDLSREAINRKHCLQHLGELDRRLDREFAGYDLTQYRDSAQQLAYQQDFDYTLLEQYNMKQEWASGWEDLAKACPIELKVSRKTFPNWIQKNNDGQ